MASVVLDADLNVTCAVCGKKYHLKPYRIKRCKKNYCSIECHRIGKMEYMKGEKNHQYGLKGEMNATWYGGRKLNRYGYWQVQAIGHPFAVGRSEYVLEHRLVAEKYLLNKENSVLIDGKRYLSPDYVVHHKNGNKTDNRVENLEVMTLSEHQRLHNLKNVKSRKRNAKGQFVKMA